ncbi:MAG TPA: hypothetical protein VNT76_20010 [Candidatus Binatus sp.]|nr:hypothetical protein [Candidatus Binatus sp.]
MDEKELIKNFYAGTVENLYKVFFNEFTLAHGDSDAEQSAKERFKKGILHARHIRDLALDLVP